MIIGNNLDLNLNELQNAKIQKLSSAPTGSQARIYFDTTLDQFGVYQGGAWVYLSASAGGDVNQVSNSGGANRLKVSAGANKTIIDFASAGGIVKVAADGTVSIAVPGTDYQVPITLSSMGTLVDGATAKTTPVDADEFALGDSAASFIWKKLTWANLKATMLSYIASATKTFTNTTIDANGTGNSITNLETADFASGVIQTSISGSSTNSQLPTALAVWNAIGAGLASNDAMILKGDIDCSANPPYPAADAGWTYKIRNTGKLGGASGVDVTAGDTAYCISDGTAAGTHAAVGSNWVIVQNNLDEATTSTYGYVKYADATLAEAKTDGHTVTTPASLVNFATVKEFTIGDGTTVTFTLTDNLAGKKATLYEIASGYEWLTNIRYTATTTILEFSVAPTTNQFKVVIVGR